MRFTYDKRLEFLDCLYRPQRKRGNMEADERIVSISKHKEGSVTAPKVPGKTMCRYSEARNRNRWVRDVGMWIMRRVKSLEEQLSKTIVQDLCVRNF